MLNPRLNELKILTKSRGIKGYKNMSKERLMKQNQQKVLTMKN